MPIEFRSDSFYHKFDLINMKITQTQFHNWLEDNGIPQDDWVYSDSTMGVVYFYNNETAMAFKLRWT